MFFSVTSRTASTLFSSSKGAVAFLMVWLTPPCPAEFTAHAERMMNNAVNNPERQILNIDVFISFLDC
jgi:hypothetical protein